MKDQEIQRLLAAGRRTKPEGGVAAHVDEAGIPVAQSGDHEAPFTKLNPFVTEPTVYWERQVLPDANSAPYLRGPIIDVAKWRTLAILCNYSGELSLIPKASLDLKGPDALGGIFVSDSTPLVPIGVVDAPITPVTINFTPGFGSRTVYRTELRNPPGTRFQMTLTFDVTMYSAFAFDAAYLEQAGEGALIDLIYVLSM